MSLPTHNNVHDRKSLYMKKYSGLHDPILGSCTSDLCAVYEDIQSHTQKITVVYGLHQCIICCVIFIELTRRDHKIHLLLHSSKSTGFEQLNVTFVYHLNKLNQFVWNDGEPRYNIYYLSGNVFTTIKTSIHCLCSCC